MPRLPLLLVALALGLGALGCAPSPPLSAEPEAFPSEGAQAGASCVEQQAGPGLNAHLGWSPAPLGGPPRLRYPAEARQAGAEGEVLVRAALTETGRVRSAEVERGVHPALDREAVLAVRRARYEPVRQGGQAVPAEVCVSLTFRLR